MLCEDTRQNNMVVVEVKCGFNDNVVSDATGRMLHELSHVTNAPMHQFQVQLAVTHALFVSKYTSGRRYKSVLGVVAQITDTGTHFTPLQPWVKEKVRHIIQRISRA